MSCFKRFGSANFLAMLAVAAGYQTVKANTYWSANPSTPDDWFDSFAWSGGVPYNDGQTAYIGNGGTATISYGSAVAEGLYVGAENTNNNGSSGTLVLTAGQLSCVNFSFYVGYGNTLGGAEGLVNQSGGAAIASNLYVANTNYSSGTYELSGNGQLEITGSETIGYAPQGNPGKGQFIQTGGTNSASGFSILNGTYSMSGNSTLAANSFSLGANVSGNYANFVIFTQSGGNVAVGNGSFNVGYQSPASYAITNGGTLNVAASNVYIGDNSNGTFTQTDSTCNFGSGAFYLAYGTASISSYTLAGNSQLYAGNEYVGYGLSSRASFTQTGGTNNLGTNSLYLGNNGNASYTLSGSGVLISGNQYLGQNANGGSVTFTQSGGTNNLGSDTLDVGCGYNTAASYSLLAGATLMAGNEYVWSNVSAIFTQTGGTNIVSSLPAKPSILGVGYPIGDSAGFGEYLLSGGFLSAMSEEIGNRSNGQTSLFDQSGGQNLTSNLTVNTEGRYDLISGTLQIATSFSNSGAFDLQNPVANGLTGTNTLTLAPLPITGTGTLIVEQNAALYSASITQGSLILGGRIQIAPGSQVSEINSLDITTGTLDITNDALIIDYPTNGPSPLSAIRSYIHAGYESGWTGGGIISSTAAGEVGVAIGYAEASALVIGSIGNVILDNTAVMVRYTWVGDANLDGVVNSADLAMIQANGSVWSDGDFNYDGQVNADDYALFQLGMAQSAGTMIPVPEGERFWGGLLIPLIFRRGKSRG